MANSLATTTQEQPEDLTSLLTWIYRTPEVRRAFKDELSDWILDRHAAGETITAEAVLKRLETTHPDVARRAGVCLRVMSV